MRKLTWVLIVGAIVLLGMCVYQIYRNNKDERVLKQGKILCEGKISPITSRIEALAAQIKDWDKRDDETGDSYIYPWSDIALSLLKYPEHVEFDYDRCPECGDSRVKLYFKSPDWTWKRMCGRSADMIICSHCKRQVMLKLRTMN